MKYKIKNWAEYQHYKHRSPPWLKLHAGLISSPDWVTATDATRVLLIACMIVASKNDGEIDASECGLAGWRGCNHISEGRSNIKKYCERLILDDLRRYANNHIQSAALKTSEQWTANERKAVRIYAASYAGGDMKRRM